jgi:hypothetical protein
MKALLLNVGGRCGEGKPIHHSKEAIAGARYRGGSLVLRNPDNREIADCLGFNETIEQTHVRDGVIVGVGPAGLAAGGL